MVEPSELRALVRAAARARARAHAPYSGFRVGAAVLAAGKVYEGCNVENVAYPLCVCAERNAVAAAVLAGARSLEAVAVVGGARRPAAPCGGCRQVLSEFCGPEVPVLCSTPEGNEVRYSLGELLPHPFGALDLAAAPRSGGGRSGRPAQASRRKPARRGT